jgi:hypothetical protein
MIPEEHQQAVIASGVAFMRAITEAYGSEQGLGLWETITSTLDPDVKAKVFFAMITGEYNYSLRVTGASTADRVAVIKAIRAADRRKLGLKDAKDLADMLWSTPAQPIILEIDPDRRVSAIRDLRAAGLYC